MNKIQKKQTFKKLSVYLIKKYLLISLRGMLGVLYGALIVVAVYFHLYTIAFTLGIILWFVFFAFSILLITDNAGKVLNRFWKDVVRYEVYYKGKKSSMFFGFLYLFISMLAATALIKMLLGY